jgi:hypothetical protein
MRGTHPDQILSLIDSYYGAKRDLAKALVVTWLASLNDQAEASAIAARPAQNEKPLTLDELAARLGKNKRTIQEWEKKFGLPSLRAHSKADPLFDWREVLEWMRRHRKNNRVERGGNGKIPSAPIKTRLQAR